MLDNVPFSDWPAAAFALVGRSDLAEMAAAAERSAAESRRAAAAAAISVTRTGTADAIPTIAEVEAFLA